MSIIFKERHYDQLLILIKNITILLLILVVLTTSINFIFNKKVQRLKVDLENLNKEKSKYQLLINNLGNEKAESSKNKYSILLIQLAQAAEDIIFNSIHFKESGIKLTAVSLEQKMIFKLIEKLKADQKFKDLRLLKINQKNKIYFELELKTLE